MKKNPPDWMSESQKEQWERCFRPVLDKKAKIKDSNSLTKAIIRHVRGEGWLAWRINTQGQWDDKMQMWRKSNSTRGVMDIIACKNGRMIGIEVKWGRDTLREEQEKRGKELVTSGGAWIVANTFDGFLSQWGKV